LDQVALPVSLLVERFRTPLILAVCDHRLDATFPRELAHPDGSVPLVPSELCGDQGRAAGVPELREVLDQGDDVLGLVLLAWADFNRQGPSLALTDQVELGAEAATAAQGVVRPLVGGYFFFEPRPRPGGRGRRYRR